MRVFFNLTGKARAIPAAEGAVLFASELTRYCGDRRGLGDVREMRAHECVVVGPAEWHAFA